MEEHRRSTRSLVVVAILVVVRVPMVEHGKDLAWPKQARSAYTIASLPSQLFTNPARAQLPLNLIYCFMSC